MNKVILGALLGAAVVVAGLFILNKPEPTPEEKMKAALENAGDAAQDAVSAAADVVSEVGESVSQSASQAVLEMTGYATNLSNETKVQLEQKLAEWKAVGIVTEDGFDFEKAATAIKESSISEASKAQINEILEALRKAPESFEAQLNELIKQLEK